MALTYYRKQYSTQYAIIVYAKDDDGAIDLSTCTAATFKMKTEAGTVVTLTGTTAYSTASSGTTKGKITFSPSTLDMTTAGKFYFEIQLDFPSSKTVTVPAAPDAYGILIIESVIA